MSRELVVLDPGEITGQGQEAQTYQELILSDTPSLYWRLGASGITDLSGNGRHGTAQGGVTIGGAAGLLTGDADASTDFDGTDDRATVTYSAFSGARTFEWWAYRDNTADYHYLVSSTTAADPYLRVNPGGTTVQFVSVGGGSSFTWPNFPTAQIVHVVLVANEPANTVDLYFDGVSQGSQAWTDAWGAATALELGSNATAGSYSWDGRLDEFAAYERALSAAEVLEHYELGANGPAVPVVTSDHVEFDLTRLIAEEGPNWGDAEIKAYMAEQKLGSVPVDFAIPNRQIEIPLLLRDITGTIFDDAREAIQAKCALWQREGGWVKRELRDGRIVFADIVNATLHLSGDTPSALNDLDANAWLRLEAIPDFYEAEDEATAGAVAGTGDVRTVLAGIRGNHPGRCRIVVTDTSGNDQRGLLWAWRSRHYDAAAAAAVSLEAEDLDPLGAAASAVDASASGGDLVRHAALPNIWTPVLGLQLTAGTYLTHAGTYKVIARVRSTSAVPPKVRLAWDVGDLVLPTENSAWEIPGANGWYLADLGEVYLQEVPLGTHRWIGEIQAKGASGGEQVEIDRVWLRCADEGGGILRAPQVSTPSSEEVVAWDAFSNAAYTGALAGEVAPLGGTLSGAGDAVDFTQDTVNLWTQRTENSDADANTGRYARLGTGVEAEVTVQADVKATLNFDEGEHRLGVFARYVDTSNWLMAVMRTVDTKSGGGVDYDRYLALYKRVPGTVTLLGSVLLATGDVVAPHTYDWRTIKLHVDAAGNVEVYEGAQGADLGEPKITVAADANLATSGALDDGGYGIYDACTSASGTNTRLLDNFYVSQPSGGSVVSDAVVYANQSAQLTTQGMLREDSTGTAYGPVSQPSELPRIPVSGLEGRSVELLVKPTRGDFESLPDSDRDDGLTVQVFFNASYLFVSDPPA